MSRPADFGGGDAYAFQLTLVRGSMVRVIVAGGGSAGLNILGEEDGEHFHDFDVPADAE